MGSQSRMAAIAIVLSSLALLVLSQINVSSSMPSSLQQCVINEKKIRQFPHKGSACCENVSDWLVKAADEDEGGGPSYKCVSDVFCSSNNETGAWYSGQCRPFFQDGVCGDEVLGERLYVGPDGNGTCDCDEGWIRHEDRCYQEFSPAFCGEGEVLNLGTMKKLEAGQQFSCIPNPCQNVENALPHRETWSDRFCHPRPDVEDIGECELFVSNKDENKSVLKCCGPWERRECAEEVLINPTGLGPHCKYKGCCGCCKVYSFFRKECVAAFNSPQKKKKGHSG